MILHMSYATSYHKYSHVQYDLQINSARIWYNLRAINIRWHKWQFASVGRLGGGWWWDIFYILMAQLNVLCKLRKLSLSKIAIRTMRLAMCAECRLHSLSYKLQLKINIDTISRGNWIWREASWILCVSAREKVRKAENSLFFSCVANFSTRANNSTCIINAHIDRVLSIANTLSLYIAKEPIHMLPFSIRLVFSQW